MIAVIVGFGLTIIVAGALFIFLVSWCHSIEGK